MAHIIENRDRMEGGTSQLPRTRTSRVPGSILDHGYIFRNKYHTISGLIEAMLGIAMAGKDDDSVATVL